MKKILAIVTMAAMVAGAFAADAAVKVRLDGNLLKVAGGNTQLLEIHHEADQHWNPNLSFSTGSDKAGASFVYYVGNWVQNGGWNWGYATATRQWAIWCKPVDALKFNIGHYETNLNQEHIDWSSTSTGCDAEGYGFNVTTNGFDLDVFFRNGANSFGNWFYDKDAGVMAPIYIKACYQADFGRIGGVFQFQKNNMWFAVGYNNNFSGVNAFVNVLGFMTTGFDKLRVEAYADGSVSGLTWQVWVPFDFTIASSTAAVGTTLKLSYGINGVTPYLYVKTADWLASGLAIQIKPGVTGSVGEMAYEFAADINVASGATTFAIPCNFTVSF